MEQEIHQGEDDGAAIAILQLTTLLHVGENVSVAEYVDIKLPSVRATLRARSSLELEDL